MTIKAEKTFEEIVERIVALFRPDAPPAADSAANRSTPDSPDPPPQNIRPSVSPDDQTP
jgi:hypothetical protein